MPMGKTQFTVRALFVAAVLGCVLGGFGCAQQSSMTDSGTPPPPSAAVTFCDNPAPGCAAGTSFSVSVLRDLSIRVQWSNLSPGNHVQTLNFILPDGNVYESMETSFAIAEEPVGATTTLQALPVAGTFITERSLTGQWRIEVSLDGEPMGSRAVRLDP